MEINNNINTSLKDEQILIWAKTIIKERKTLIGSVLIGLILGLLIVLVTPKEYVAWTSVVPQSSKNINKLGGLSSIAAMAGFNLDLSGEDDITPAMYPQIVNSVPFQVDLMNMPFQFSDSEQTMSLYTYYSTIVNKRLFYLIYDYTIGLPGKIKESISGNKVRRVSNKDFPISLSHEQDKVRRIIARKVNLEVDVKYGFLTLNARFQDPELSAQVAAKGCELLQQYITRFKIKKATDQLSFIEDRYQEKKKEFLKAQQNLAIFRDQNRNVSSALFATEEERLQSEYTIAQSVYNELAKQLEQAKIKVKEDTPVFSVIEPASVPQKASKPKSIMILTIWIIMGGLVGLGIIFGKNYIHQLKNKWNETLSEN